MFDLTWEQGQVEKMEETITQKQNFSTLVIWEKVEAYENEIWQKKSKVQVFTGQAVPNDDEFKT